MHAAEVVRRIYRETQFWEKAGDGPEVAWTVRGLGIALGIVRALAAEEHAKALARRPRLSRWVAGDLFRAVTQALAYLRRGDRGQAIKELEAALAAATTTLKVRKVPTNGH